MKQLRRIDAGLAKGEATLATIVLLVLVVVAAAQSLFRNLADGGMEWANDVLEQLSWGDTFMEKATLWLAMFGASLATHEDKHIAIDVLPRIAKPVPRAAMRGIAWTFAGLTCLAFAKVVLDTITSSVLIPTELGVFDENFETVHICLGTAAQIADANLERPGIFCALRGGLEGMGVTIQTPERAMDLLVPIFFVIMGIRFSLKGVGAFLRISSGGIPDDELEGAKEAAEEAAKAKKSKSDESDSKSDEDSDSKSDDSDSKEAAATDGEASDEEVPS